MFSRPFFYGVGATIVALIVGFIITCQFLPHKGETTLIMGGTMTISALIISLGTCGLLLWVKIHAGG